MLAGTRTLGLIALRIRCAQVLLNTRSPSGPLSHLDDGALGKPAPQAVVERFAGLFPLRDNQRSRRASQE
jgi:hypothetical protein